MARNKVKIYQLKGKVAIKKKKLIRILIIVAVALMLIGAGATYYVRHDYQHNLRAVSSSTTQQYFTVESGLSVKQISQKLQSAGLIRSATAFQWYVRTAELNDSLKAGTFALTPSMTTQDIAKKIAGGDVVRNLLTILPGKRLDQIKQAFKDAGYSDAQIAVAFNPSTYKGHPVLAELPAGKSLEGYLSADSYDHQAETPASTVVKAALDEMDKKLSPDIIAGFKKQGLTTFQGVTLASVVEQEASSAKDRAKVAQVFLKRYKLGMMLGSDVTAYYGAILAGQTKAVSYDSPYNTRIHTGLPIGPISNVSLSSLQAVGNPADTDYLYFIAGDDGNMYFTFTEDQHQAAIKQHCQIGCAVQ